MELYDVIELYFFSERTVHIELQAHTFTTAIAAVQCYTRQEVLTL